MKLPSWIMVTLCLLSQSGSLAIADDSLDEKRRFLVAGMRAERESIRSGIARITGSRSEVGKAWGEFNVNVKYVVAFDYDKHLFRFDESGYQMVWVDTLDPQQVRDRVQSNLPMGEDISGRKWVTVESGGSLVKTDEYDLYRPIHSRTINRLPSGSVRGTSVHVFDTRALGLMGLIEFQQGKSVDDLLNVMEKIPITIEHLQSPKGYHGEYSNTRLKQEFWLDETRGMSPYRWVTTRSGQVTFQSDTEWKSISHVWLPSTYAMIDNSLSDVQKSWHLVLEWDDVNAPLDPQLFTAAGLATDENASVVDLTLGRPVLEPVFPSKMPEMTPGMTAKPDSPDARSRWELIILANVIGVGVALWFFRRRARRQAP